MPRSAAIQMDALDGLNVKTDSTLLLAQEAQLRGYDIWCYTPDKLSLLDGRITAFAQRVTFHADPEYYYEVLAEEQIDLRSMDVVWLRQDPPFDMTYLTTTYILEQLSGDTLVVNNPSSVRNLPEKFFPTLLHKYMPPTLISADMEAISQFRDEHKDVIIKPLYGFGGRSVLRLKDGDKNFHALTEMLFSDSSEPLIIQAFIPDVTTGERRIILVDGEVGGVMARIPAKDEIRANLRVGATAAKVELTAKQREICETLKPDLKKHGLIFVGLDVIGDWLIEINITSPTGLVAMNDLYDLTLESDIWDAVEKQL